MSSLRAKLLLGLLALLAGPCMGLGGRAEARFALAPAAQTERTPGSPGFELQLILNGEAAEEHATSGAGPVRPEEPTPFGPAGAPPIPSRVLDLLATPGSAHTGGASSTGSPSAGSVGGGSLAFILNSPASAPGPEQAGRLFLADERFKPPPFASRWFRPPR